MLKATLIGLVGALIAVVVTLLVGDAVSGPLLVTSPGADGPEELEIGAALMATIVGAIAGLGLAAATRRFAANAPAVFVAVCVVGLTGYGIFSFTASEEFATGVWLNVMHVVAAVPIVGALTRQLATSGE